MILETQNITKQYKNKDGIINACDNISLSIEKGSFVTITGASGSGKTTLLLILGGLLKPTGGVLKFNDKVLNTSNDNQLVKYRRENIGFVMQSFALIPYLTAIENIMVSVALVEKNPTKQKEIAEALLKKVDLENRKNHYPKELSAGQQQRVAIARALANNPKIILADEPTGNLDPQLSAEILKVLKKFNETDGITIVMVTHSTDAANYGNVKIALSDGKII